MPTPVVDTIYRQLLALGLKRQSCRFVAWDEQTLKVSRRLRGVLIRYNAGCDLYDIDAYAGSDVHRLADGVYAGNLLAVIRPVLDGTYFTLVVIDKH